MVGPSVELDRNPLVVVTQIKAKLSSSDVDHPLADTVAKAVDIEDVQAAPQLKFALASAEY